MKPFLLFSLILWLGGPLSLLAQDDPNTPKDPFDWRSELKDENFDDKKDPLEEYEWKNWSEKDWEDEYKEDYQDYYKKKEAQKILGEAYQQAQEQGIKMPQRHGPLTYDPKTNEVYFESDEDYQDQLNDFLDGLEDELTEFGKDAALEALYLALEPTLKALKKKNSAILDAVIPRGSGVPVWDPAEEEVKENEEGKKNFKYWIKLAAENVMQNLFKKNAEGKWELQRSNVEQLKEVGIIRFLKMSVLDWELATALELEVPDAIMDYSETLKGIYTSGKSTFEAGKELYQEVSALDTELALPTSLDQLKEIGGNLLLSQMTMQEMVKKRQKVLALAYQELADRYQEYAEDLNDKLLEDNVLKMTDGERLKAHDIVQSYLQQSIQLKAHAEELLDMHQRPHDQRHKEEMLEIYTTYQRVKSQIK